MKTNRYSIPASSRAVLFAALLATGTFSVLAQADAPSASENSTATNAPAAMATEKNAAISTNDVAASTGAETSTNGLMLNFRNAPLDLVLQYLSKAAGFIIQVETPVHGNVTVISANPMTKDEAVDLLNSVLNKNGYAAIRSGERTLRIMDKGAAKSSGNPVKIGNDPDSIPDNDEMVTQIIPIRFVEAQQLVSDISPFVSPQATVIANQAGNSIVITDIQSNIKHLVEIIKAIDSSAEDVTEVKVFKLQYADPTEMATLLTSLFPDQNTAQAPIRFGRGGRGGRGGFNPFAAAFGGGNNNNGNSVSDRIKKRNQVVAVADARTSSVVVTATADLMDQISEMIAQLDNPSNKGQRVAVIHINNADPQEILPVLQDTFGGNNTRNRNNSTQLSPFQYRIQQNQNNSGVNTSRGTFGGSGLGNRGGGFGR
ncbi:MAG TPA: secretin N-terminal domain-containing protein [Verrucomicrobiae bacterium]|nr:secretin N-terminal domain-containing protein [Verrucomicrobiae bacterium]